jgi:hypothetical protein
MCKCPTGYECGECIKTPHKHAELIKAWADGAKIQFFTTSDNAWKDCWGQPSWNLSTLYRITPELKPDVVMTRFLHKKGDCLLAYSEAIGNLHKNEVKLTFDGETGKLKAVELI